MEEKLFGLYRTDMQEQRINERTWIPLKTGTTGSKFLKNAPHHYLDAEYEEPVFVPQDNILEECLKREAERVGYNETLINKVVYDSMEDKNGNVMVQDPETNNSEVTDKP